MRAHYRIITALSAGALILALAACGGSDSGDDNGTTSAAAGTEGLPDLSGQKLTYTSFGEDADDAIEAAWNDPFAEATGAQVATVAGLDYVKIHEQVDSGNVVDNLIHAEPVEVDAFCGEYYEPIEVDESVLPEGLKPFSDCGLPLIVYSTLVAHNTDEFPDGGPKDCGDFFDTEQFPGERMLFSYVPASAAIECAAIAAGADPTDPYPIDLDAAFAELDGIKEDLALADVPAQQIEAMRSGDVAMGLMLNDATGTAISQGAPFATDFGFVLRLYSELGVAKGTEDLDAAQAYVDYISQPQVAQSMPEALPEPLPFGVAAGFSGASYEDLPEDIREFAPDQADAVDVDWRWWIDNYDEINKRWNEFIAQ